MGRATPVPNRASTITSVPAANCRSRASPASSPLQVAARPSSAARAQLASWATSRFQI